jgi:hypothetical protein
MLDYRVDVLLVSRICLCQAEIEHLHFSIRCDLDVGGFQIPLNHPLLMSGFEGFGDLLTKP